MAKAKLTVQNFREEIGLVEPRPVTCDDMDALLDQLISAAEHHGCRVFRDRVDTYLELSNNQEAGVQVCLTVRRY